MKYVNASSLFESTKLTAFWVIHVGAGLLFVILIGSVILLSTPVFLLRVIVIHLAKYIRPDLGEPLNPLSVGIVGDLYSSSRPPRANVVVHLTFDGNLEVTLFEKLIENKWIQARTSDGKLKYPEFSQFPMSWLLGFMFWKTDENFDIKNYIYLHQNPDGANDEDLHKLIEELLNARNPPSRSPWEFHIFQNYRNHKLHTGEMGVVIMKLHHSLSDGFGIFSAIAEDLLGQDKFPFFNGSVPTSKKKDFWGKLAHTVMTPVIWGTELSRLAWHMSTDNPLKIPDHEKAWHQLYAKSELIPIQTIKHIKDTFGVSFTSVPLSAISFAIHKTLERKRFKGTLRVKNYGNSIQCLNVIPLPAKTRHARLTNHLTGALFPIPTGNFSDPLKRLRECNQAMEETKNSIIPALGSAYINCFGSHFRWVLPFMMKCQTIGTGISNLPGFPKNSVLTGLGRKLLLTEVAVGPHEGATGIAFKVVSSCDHVRVAVMAEKGLLSRDELEALVKSVEEEISRLHSLCNSKGQKKVIRNGHS